MKALIRTALVGLGFALIGIFSLYWLKHSKAPFIVIGMVFSLYLLALTFMSSSFYKVILWNLCAIVLILTLCECLLAHKAFVPSIQPALNPVRTGHEEPAFRTEGNYSDPEGYFKDDLFLGYRPKQAARIRSARFYGDSVVYDVTYTIGPDRLRVTDSMIVDKIRPLFFSLAILLLSVKV